MAPEQRRAGSSIDARADIHAASAVVAHAAFGECWRDILLEDSATGATGVETPGSEPVAFELRRGLATDPDDRHPTIDEWTQAVLGALDDHHETGRHPNQRGPRRAGGRRRLVRLVAGALVVAALVAAAASVTRIGSADDASPTRTMLSPATGEPDGPDIIGPDSILLGDPATFTHPDRAGVDYRWITPTGDTSGEAQIVFTPNEPVDFEITLIETDRGVERTSTRRILVRTR